MTTRKTTSWPELERAGLLNYHYRVPGTREREGIAFAAESPERADQLARKWAAQHGTTLEPVPAD